ncbi:MAG: acyl-CoA thioesterase [archaeon]|nr:MAG: acyl-CoA thioesterase [archaeon]
MGSWHESRLRVRFEETDTMQVVYYGKFFVWMEVGRVNLMRDIGLPYGDWEKQGLAIPVVQAHADYRASAHFDEEILVKTRVSEVGNRSVKFENEVHRLPEGELLCTGHTVHALTGKGGLAVVFSEELRQRLISS